MVPSVGRFADAAGNFSQSLRVVGKADATLAAAIADIVYISWYDCNDQERVVILMSL
jgi:hypothetical protein